MRESKYLGLSILRVFLSIKSLETLEWIDLVHEVFSRTCWEALGSARGGED